MPGGGGSAGGGGGGGGSRGSWSKRNSFNRNYSSGVHYSVSKEGECSCAVCCVILLAVVLTLAVTALIVGLAIGFGATSPKPTDIATSFFAPGDSRLVSLSSFFCDGGVLELSANTVDAELFVVDSIPPLNDTNNFTVTTQRSINSLEFRFWQYHLYPNSNISISVCTDLLVDVYIVKGNENANSWAESPSSDVAELVRYAGGCCPNELRYAPEITYRVNEEDEYYIILHNSLKSSIFINASFTFERYEYNAPENIDPDKYCDVESGGRCSFGIPYGTGLQRTLVITSISENIDWEENVSVTVNCGQRGWAYALVILLPMVVVAVIIAVIVLAIVIHYQCGNKSESKPEDEPQNSDDFNPDPDPS